MPRALVVTAIVGALAASAVRANADGGCQVVVANEVLAEGGSYVPSNMEAFLRRIEVVAGWPKGFLRGRAFDRPAAALEHLRQNKVSFAILPTHQFLQGRKELKLEVLGRAVGFEGSDPTFSGVTRSGPRQFQSVDEFPGLRLAMTEIDDLQWINVLFEAKLRPETHFSALVPVKSGQEAVQAVLADKADLALLYEKDFRAVRGRVTEGGDLAWVYTSGGVRPSPVLAVGKWAAPSDRKKLEAALGKICREGGADACARVGIAYIEPGKADSYRYIIQKYDHYR